MGAHIPQVSTDRLHLVAYRQGDADALAAILGEPDVSKNITANGSTPERCLESARQRINWHKSSWSEHGYGVLAVRAGAGLDGVAPDTLLGWCGFAAPDIGDDPELLYGLVPTAWGRGLASEAASAAIDWLFDETGEGGVSAVIFHRINARSIRIVQKLGLSLRGTMSVADFYSSDALARDVLEFELWRLAEGRSADAEALLFEAPYRIGQLMSLDVGESDAVFDALSLAARNRPDYQTMETAELAERLLHAFKTGLSEPHLEWYHRGRRA